MLLGIDLVPGIQNGSTLAAMHLMAFELTSGLNTSV